MITLVYLLTFVWLAFWLLAAVRRLSAGSRWSLLFAIPLHFLLCGVPLLLDVVMGIPEYSIFPGYYKAANDETTCLIYCAYVAFCPVLWWVFVPPDAPHRQPREPRQLKPWLQYGPSSLLLKAVLVLPILLVLAYPNRDVYMAYTPAYRAAFGVELGSFHLILVQAIRFSLIAAGALVYRAESVWRRLLAIAPILLADCWLHGKRNIVAFLLLIMLYTLWKRKVLVGPRLFAAGAAGAVLMLGFSMVYQMNYRYLNDYAASRTMEDWYDNVRVDYGRDALLKLCIYDELYQDAWGILDYRGQSVMMIATAWIPRRFWPDKPPGYDDVTMTAAREGPAPFGGGMTTTCLAEAVSNCSWFGCLLGPLVVVLICRIGDSFDSPVIQQMTVLVMVNVLTVFASAWIVLAGVWVFLMLYDKATTPSPTFVGPAMLSPNSWSTGRLY